MEYVQRVETAFEIIGETNRRAIFAGVRSLHG